jgi:hypothetical protein
MEHYVNRNLVITNENATIRIFGKDTDSNKHSHNRQTINREIEWLISDGILVDNITQVVLTSTGIRKKQIKGYALSYDVYKLLCLKFDKQLYTYYIKLEQIMFE